ncbi:hypothetical protein BH23ACT11_BH23ACT11_02210 [soil metagenome]
MLDGVRHRILHVRATPKGYLVDLDGISDRGQAGALRGKELILDRSELDVLEEDEFYVGDLVGMTAVDENGVSRGIVEEVLETPAHEILLIRDGQNELYVPFTITQVPHVDSEERSLTIVPLEET